MLASRHDQIDPHPSRKPWRRPLDDPRRAFESWESAGNHVSTMIVDRIARLHIKLDDTQPSIWRRVEVPLTMSLKGLHDVIQAVMLFGNYHLFEFEAGGRYYEVPDPEDDCGRKTFAARNIRIGTLFEREITLFKYTYDFGDNWRHTITVETVEDGNPSQEYPRFVDGAHRAPPEDVGGSSGFEEFLKVMAKPKHRQHREFVRWYGRRFDPYDLSIDIVQSRLGKLALRRARGKAGFAKSQRKQH